MLLAARSVLQPCSVGIIHRAGVLDTRDADAAAAAAAAAADAGARRYDSRTNDIRCSGRRAVELVGDGAQWSAAGHIHRCVLVACRSLLLNMPSRRQLISASRRG